MDDRYKLDNFAIPVQYSARDSEWFISSDTEELFKKNLTTMPADWHYRTKEVRYNLNSLGYRTKEFADIDQNNFFITYGCSFTSGIGLAEDEIWTDAVAKELGIECLNLGVGGAGMDYIYLNTLTYLKNNYVKPRFVIIQCPDPSRMLMRSLKKFHTCGVQFPGPGIVNEMYNQAIKDESYLHTIYLAWHNTMTFWQTAGVPVYFWVQNLEEWRNLIPGVHFEYFWPTEDETTTRNRARDLMHFPASYHIRTGRAIAEKIRNNPKFGIDNSRV